MSVFYVSHYHVLLICKQLLDEFMKLPAQYQFDSTAEWWKILGDKMKENQKALEVCTAAQ